MKIGITGSIGSGKTTVCKAFEALGVPVYYADDRAKSILDENKKVIKAVKILLGKDIYHSNGKLKRKEVAKIVFADKKVLKKYNAIIHPEVMKDFEAWAKKQKQKVYVLKEAALLFEAGAEKGLAFVICVTAPEKIRIQRVMKRDNTQRIDIIRRMKNQLSQKEKMKRSLFRINNNGQESIAKQVYDLHEMFMKRGGRVVRKS